MYFPFYSALQTQITISAYRKKLSKIPQIIKHSILDKSVIKTFPTQRPCFSSITKMLPFCAQGMFSVALRVQNL